MCSCVSRYLDFLSIYLRLNFPVSIWFLLSASLKTHLNHVTSATNSAKKTLGGFSCSMDRRRQSKLQGKGPWSFSNKQTNRNWFCLYFWQSELEIIKRLCHWVHGVCLPLNERAESNDTMTGVTGKEICLYRGSDTSTCLLLWKKNRTGGLDEIVDKKCKLFFNEAP